MVQSGGIQPVADMPAKFVDAVGAEVGSSPGPSATGAAAIAANSLFLAVSLASVATGFASLAFGAASFRAWNSALGIGYRFPEGRGAFNSGGSGRVVR